MNLRSGKKKKEKVERWYVGFFKVVYSYLMQKPILQNEIERLTFRLELRDEEIRDLNNRLEAYKDALAALNREYRLQGMLAESDLRKISQPKVVGETHE